MAIYMNMCASLRGLKEILHRWLHISGCEARGLTDAGDRATLHGGRWEPDHHPADFTQHPRVEPLTTSIIYLASSPPNETSEYLQSQ
jgi:hypothetical protein